jgi:hypothetical protein
VIGKAEWTNGEANPRFIVTNIHAAFGPARFLYEDVLYEGTAVKHYSIAKPLSVSRCQFEDVDLGSFGRGQALQRIALYPVRVRAPSSHNRYSRMPKA